MHLSQAPATRDLGTSNAPYYLPGVCATSDNHLKTATYKCIELIPYFCSVYSGNSEGAYTHVRWDLTDFVCVGSHSTQVLRNGGITAGRSGRRVSEGSHRGQEGVAAGRSWVPSPGNFGREMAHVTA